MSFVLLYVSIAQTPWPTNCKRVVHVVDDITLHDGSKFGSTSTFPKDGDDEYCIDTNPDALVNCTDGRFYLKMDDHDDREYNKCDASSEFYTVFNSLPMKCEDHCACKKDANGHNVCPLAKIARTEFWMNLTWVFVGLTAGLLLLCIYELYSEGKVSTWLKPATDKVRDGVNDATEKVSNLGKSIIGTKDAKDESEDCELRPMRVIRAFP